MKPPLKLAAARKSGKPILVLLEQKECAACLASSLDYVASGAYRSQPEFQRFIEARAAALRAKGEQVELMK